MSRSTMIVAVLLLPLCRISAQTGPAAAAEPVTLRLDLAQAIDLALQNNLELKSALIDERISQERIREALGAFDPAAFSDLRGGRNESLFASQFPADPANPQSGTVTRVISNKSDTLDATLGVRGVLETGLSYELSFNTNYFNDLGGSDFNPIFTTSTTLTLSQPLLRAGWSSYGQAPVDLAMLGARGAHEEFRGEVREKIKEVEIAYYDLVFALEDREVKRKSLELADRQVQITRVKVRTGALARVEITTAESGRAQRNADLVTAEAAVVAAEDRLRRLILALEQESEWETHLVPTERPEEHYVTPRGLKVILRRAEAAEPTVLRARLDVAEAEVALDQRQSEALPRLDLSGRVGSVGLFDTFGESLRLGYEADGALSWNLGLAFEYPLGNRAASARVVQAELELRKARIGLQNTRTELAFQIRRSLRDIEVARRSITARKEATRLGQEQLENERLKLDLRTATNFEVFQVEEDLSQRRTQEIRAVLDYRLALLELVRVTSLPLDELVEQDAGDPKEGAGHDDGGGR